LKFLQVLLLSILLQNTLFASNKEELLKGVILERISQFISFDNSKDVFRICVYKNHKMANSFKELFETRKYKDKPIEVLSTSFVKKIDMCDVFYAEKLSKKDLQTLVNLKQDHTLLVTEKIDNVKEGFMVALYLKNNKINFAINQQALVDAKLKVNYRLLRVASRVINPVTRND